MESLALGVGVVIYKTLLDRAVVNLYETVESGIVHAEVKSMLEEVMILPISKSCNTV